MTPGEPASSTLAIRLDNTRFHWQNRSEAVLDIARWEVPAGARIFVEGPSGSGKTTLLNLLCGINEPSHGELYVLGHPMHALGNAARDQIRCDDIGVIFQQFNLLPYLSVIDNVTLPCALSARRLQRAGDARGEAQRLLAALDIAPALQHKPVRELSVGQQQRVAAARAFIGTPALIIADEPTSALDATRQDAFIDLLNGQCASSGATLVFVSHNPALARHFDEVISLTSLQGRHASGNATANQVKGSNA